jgi:hypothetical protein
MTSQEGGPGRDGRRVWRHGDEFVHAIRLEAQGVATR